MFAHQNVASHKLHYLKIHMQPFHNKFDEFQQLKQHLDFDILKCWRHIGVIPTTQQSCVLSRMLLRLGTCSCACPTQCHWQLPLHLSFYLLTLSLLVLNSLLTHRVGLHSYSKTDRARIDSGRLAYQNSAVYFHENTLSAAAVV